MTDTFDRSIEYFNSRTTQNGDRWPLIVPYDFEIRFTYQPDNWGLEPGAFNSGENVLIQVPFELWNIGVNTIDDPDDDYRLFPYLMDTNDDGAFGLSPIDHYVSGGNDDPETDWIYWVKPADISPGESGYMTIMNDAVNNTAGHEYFGPTTAGTDVMRRIVLVNWNGGDVYDPSFPANINATMPEPGTVFRILTNKPVSEIDTFEINTAVAAIAPSELPLQFELQQNFPNPFNLSTQIRFSIPYDSDLQLTVYNILGQRVITLADGRYSRGRHTIRWAGRDQYGRVVSSGIYVYKLKADAYTESRKMVLIK
jgi:hypothetical protein